MKIIVVLLIVIFLVVYVAQHRDTPPAGSQTGRQESISSSEASESRGGPSGLPQDYFPRSIGMRWKYAITTGPGKPLNFKRVTWMTGPNSGVRQTVRGTFISSLPGRKKDVFSLILRVAAIAPQQGRLNWDGVKLAVEKDELGIFEHTDGVFWAQTRGGSLSVIQVVTFPPSAPGAPSGPWGSWGAESGSSEQIVFFADRPNTSTSFGSASEPVDRQHDADRLIFLGPDKDGLHFVREVGAGKPYPGGSDGDFLNRPFKEHTWFRKNTGLVRLEQVVDGQTSMTWQLEEFQDNATVSKPPLVQRY